jgi:hypothetical protein
MEHATTFAIPAYRLRDVVETVERYDENFGRNGHAVPLVVFDDSSPATHEKYYSGQFGAPPTRRRFSTFASTWASCARPSSRNRRARGILSPSVAR